MSSLEGLINTNSHLWKLRIDLLRFQIRVFIHPHEFVLASGFVGMNVHSWIKESLWIGPKNQRKMNSISER